MHEMKAVFRHFALFACVFVAACGLHRYEPDLSPEQTSMLETIGATVHYDMAKADVREVLGDAGIGYSEKLSPLFSGGYMEAQYGSFDALFVDVVPANLEGCRDGVLVIIRFNAEARVHRVIEEYVNFCT